MYEYCFDHVWAIDDGSGKLLGVFRFDSHCLPPWQDGMRTALFTTRKEAKMHLPKVKGPSNAGLYPKAKVVKVQVRIAPC